MLRPLACLGLVVLSLCAARPAQAAVVVVDAANGPGADFEFLWQAIDAAADGDVLLVRPGFYETWSTVDGRSLSLVADGDHVSVHGTITVRNLAAGQRVVLRGLELGYPGSVELYDNDGVVYVEDCEILADQEGGAGQYAGILAVDSRLVVSRCTVAGSLNYAFHDTPPTPGLQAVRSEVVVTSSTLVGGDGTDPYADSVPGLWLDESSATMQGTIVIGGYGDTAVGGTGLVALNGSSLRLLQSSTTGGGGTPVGEAQMLDGSSTVLGLPGAAHALASASPVREGELVSVTVQGAPGDLVWLALSLAPGWTPVFGGQHVLTVGSPIQLFALGPLGPGGQLTLSSTVPSLGALESLDLILQELSVGAGGGAKTAGPTTVVTLLDAAF
jgi:hypothetical protein